MIDLYDIFHQWAHSNQISRWDRPEQPWEQWALQQGWLRESKPASGLRCPDCQAYCKVLGTRNHSGDLVHYLPCEECGSLVIDEAELHQWRWDSKVLTSAVSSLICPGQQVVELVADQVWVLGKLTLSAVRPQLVLFRSAKAVVHHHVRQWQLTNKSVIGLFPSTSNSTDWKGDSFVLSNALKVDDQDVRLTEQWHVFLQHAVNARAPTIVRRKRRSDRAVNVEKITNYLIHFLNKRQQHAKVAFLSRLDEGLLPCPTQKEIAHATKLHKTIVSNCLRDQQAKGLQGYWKLCQSLNVNDCYRFRAPEGKPSDMMAQDE